MSKPAPTTVADSLFWCYANLAMAHAAVGTGATRYGTLHYMIRARLYKGLRAGTMNVGSLADDERLKMVVPQACCYCGGTERLSLDHLLPTALGGPDTGDNLVWACRSCNSSKGKKDLLRWFAARGELPPVLLLRRYLKVLMKWCDERGIANVPLSDTANLALPFRLRTSRPGSHWPACAFGPFHSMGSCPVPACVSEILPARLSVRAAPGESRLPVAPHTSALHRIG